MNNPENWVTTTTVTGINEPGTFLVFLVIWLSPCPLILLYGESQWYFALRGKEIRWHHKGIIYSCLCLKIKKRNNVLADEVYSERIMVKTLPDFCSDRQRSKTARRGAYTLFSTFCLHIFRSSLVFARACALLLCLPFSASTHKKNRDKFFPVFLCNFTCLLYARCCV